MSTIGSAVTLHKKEMTRSDPSGWLKCLFIIVPSFDHILGNILENWCWDCDKRLGRNDGGTIRGCKIKLERQLSKTILNVYAWWNWLTKLWILIKIGKASCGYLMVDHVRTATRLMGRPSFFCRAPFDFPHFGIQHTPSCAIYSRVVTGRRVTCGRQPDHRHALAPVYHIYATVDEIPMHVHKVNVVRAIAAHLNPHKALKATFSALATVLFAGIKLSWKYLSPAIDIAHT